MKIIITKNKNKMKKKFDFICGLKKSSYLCNVIKKKTK